MQVTRRVTPKPQRRGFTLIELLVVISIIAVLAALLLPGIGAARATARRTQCMNQMRNVSMATQVYATNNNGSLPHLITNPAINPSTVQIDTDGAAATPGYGASWAVQLLPYLENQSLFDRLTAGDGEAVANGNDRPSVLIGTSIQIYTCPDDPDTDAPGTLSFVANAGYTTEAFWGLDLDAPHIPGGPYDFSFDNYLPAPGQRSNDDIDVFKGTGLFFVESNFGRSALDRIPDGSSHTVLLSENIQATGWASNEVEDVSFVVPFAAGGEAGDFADNAGTLNGLGPAAGTGSKSSALDFDFAGALGVNFSGTTLATSKINNDPGASDGTRPRPSSLHPNVVNVMFADGHGGPINQSIADSVWVRLVSASGERFGQQVLSDSDF